MADNTTLAGLLSGSNSPLASQILNAQQDQSQLDLAQNNAAWGNQQGPLQALARAISAVNGRTGLNADLANIQAQKASEYDDLTKMYASGMDNASYIAAHPETGDLAKAMVFSQSPETTAQTNLVSQQANILRQRASMLKNIPGAQAAWNAGGPNANVSVAPAPIPNVSGLTPSADSSAGGGNWETQHNNLGGLRIPGSTVGPQAGGFQSFDSPEAGVQAISHQLGLYGVGSPATGGKPLNTLNQIVSTWAPPNENDTPSLIARASKVTGFAPDQQLDLTDPSTKAKLIEATIRNEQGGNLPIDPAIIAKVAGVPQANQIAQATPPTATDATPADAGIAALGASGAPTGAATPTAPPSPAAAGIAALAGAGAPRLGPQQQVPQPPAQPTNIAAPTPGVAALAAAGNPAAAPPSPAPAGGTQGAPNAAPVATATPAAKIDPAEIARWQQWANQGFDLANQYDQAGLSANAQNIRAQMADNPQYQAFKERMAKQTDADVAIANAGPLAEATDLGKIHDYRTGGAGFKYNPATGRMDIVAQNPQLPVGTSLTMGPNDQPIAAEVPGAMGAIQAAAQAHNAVPKLEKVVDRATGQKYYQYMTAPMAGGASTSAPSAPVSPAGGAAGTIPLGAPSPTGNAAAPPGSVAALGPGQHEALVTRANEEQKQRQEVIDQGGAAQQMQAGLQNMQNDMGTFTQGPLAEHTQTALKYLRLIVPSFNGPVASYEDFIKNAGSLTRAAVHETSPRASQQEYAMINNTLPNPEMSPQGLQMVTNELMGLSDYKIAKAQAQQQFEQAHGGIGNVSGFETDFQKNVTPYAFIIGRMAPPDRLQMISKLQASPEGKIELGKIGQQMQYIKSTGLDQALQ